MLSNYMVAMQRRVGACLSPALRGVTLEPGGHESGPLIVCSSSWPLSVLILLRILFLLLLTPLGRVQRASLLWPATRPANPRRANIVPTPIKAPEVPRGRRRDAVPPTGSVSKREGTPRYVQTHLARSLRSGNSLLDC